MLVYEKKIVRGEIVRKIAFVTGSRADYGIMRRYLALYENAGGYFFLYILVYVDHFFRNTMHVSV